MDQAATEREIIERMLAVFSRRVPSYSGCSQTTIFRNTQDGPRNLLTKYECVRGRAAAQEFAHEYPEVGIVRRMLRVDAVPDCFKRLANDHSVDIGTGIDVRIDTGFSLYGKTRWSHSEWSDWPSDIFTLEPLSSGPWSPSASLVSVDAPYFTSLDQVLSAFFAQAGPNWANQFRGQIVAILPDFRARIARLLVAPRSYRADLEVGVLNLDQVLLKTCVQRHDGSVSHETLRPTECVERDLPEGMSSLWMALIHASTGETLHEKAYREGVAASDPDVLVDSGADEIEQALLIGESETIELKRELTSTTAEKLARTAVAFANTKGGKIIFGIDDDHHIVGCDVRGMVDRITSLLRHHCDPVPSFKPRVVVHSNRSLVVIDIEESVLAVPSSRTMDRSYERTEATVIPRAMNLLSSTDSVSATLISKGRTGAVVTAREATCCFAWGSASSGPTVSLQPRVPKPECPSKRWAVVGA